jgi:hypothetical protein
MAHGCSQTLAPRKTRRSCRYTGVRLPDYTAAFGRPLSFFPPGTLGAEINIWNDMVFASSSPAELALQTLVITGDSGAAFTGRATPGIRARGHGPGTDPSCPGLCTFGFDGYHQRRRPGRAMNVKSAVLTEPIETIMRFRKPKLSFRWAAASLTVTISPGTGLAERQECRQS